MGWQFRTRGGDTRMTMTSRGTTGIDDPSGNGSYQVNMRGQWHFWTVRYDGLKKLQRGDGRTEYNVDDTGAIAPAPDRYMTLGARHDSGTSFNSVETGRSVKLYSSIVRYPMMRCICWKIIFNLNGIFHSWTQPTPSR